MKRIFLSVMVLVVCASFQAQAMKGLLEKRAYYVTKAKSGELVFWVIFLGGYDCSLIRKYPGEDSLPIKATVNYSMLSSGYIEGNGYSAKGKIDCMPTMKLKNDKGERTIELDSIDCIFDFGQKVRTVKGEVGDFVIDLEGQPKIANRFVLTEYKTVTSSDGERELKKNGDDIPLSAIAFTREGIARAIKGIPMPSKPKTDTASPPAVK